MDASIVHLFGYPAAGKNTVAQALAAAAGDHGMRMVVLDNHLTANAVLSVVDTESSVRVPRVVWDRVDEVREVVYRTIEDLSPGDWSFVATNVMREGAPGDLETAERVELMAQRRGSRYVPVRLECRTDELLRRVPHPDRAARLKWTDPDAVADYVAERPLLELPGRDVLVLDTTELGPTEVAERILADLVRRSTGAP